MKIKIKKSIALLVIAISICGLSEAQVKHEYSLYGAGGQSALNYSLNGADINKKAGYSFGLGYSYFFTEKWAINTGLELSRYKTEADLNTISASYDAIDSENENFEYQYSIGGYRETQTAMYLNIPIMVQFQTSEGDGFYAALGGKIGIPASSKYKSYMSSIATKGYYPATDVTYDDLLYSGFGKYSDINMKEDLDLKVAFMLSAEVGIKSKLSESLKLYTGVFVDYGLNNVAKQGKTFMTYDAQNPSILANESILHSHYRSEGEAISFVEKVKPIAFGIKVKLAFGR